MTTLQQTRHRHAFARVTELEIPRLADYVFLAMGVLFWGLLSLRAGKDLNWDIFNYHFYNGWAAWTGHDWDNMAPAQLQSFLNPALDIPQYFMIAHLPAWCAGFIIGAFQGLGFSLVLAIVRSVEGLGRNMAGKRDRFSTTLPRIWH